MFTVTYHPQNKDITRRFQTKEEADNFKKNIRSMGLKIIASDEVESDYKIDWPKRE